MKVFLKNFSYDFSQVLLRASDRYLCFGSAAGEIGIMDLRTRQLRRHWIRPPASQPLVLYDFDVHDYSLFACAYDVDANGAIPSCCSVSAYDLRVCKATSPITAALSPTLIRFLPNSCGQRFLVADDRGRYQILDSVASSGSSSGGADGGRELYQIEAMLPDAFTCSLDVASSGQGMAIADTSGSVCVFSVASLSSKPGPRWNAFSRPTSAIEVGIWDFAWWHYY